MNMKIKINDIVPVITNGMIFLFGQWFLIPLTKLIIAMVKHGMKTNRIAHAMSTRTSTNNHPTTNIPINAMPILYFFYELIAIILERKSHYFAA